MIWKTVLDWSSVGLAMSLVLICVGRSPSLPEPDPRDRSDTESKTDSQTAGMEMEMDCRRLCRFLVMMMTSTL